MGIFQQYGPSIKKYTVLVAFHQRNLRVTQACSTGKQTAKLVDVPSLSLTENRDNTKQEMQRS